MKDIDKLIIYIQMEYCKMTLGDFIEDSNKQLEEYAGLNKDYEVCHSNENLIEHIKIFLNI